MGGLYLHPLIFYFCYFKKQDLFEGVSLVVSEDPTKL